MIRFGFPVDVARPVAEVFAYVTEPGNLPEWQETDQVQQLTSGSVGKGTRFREVRELFGRRLVSTSEVADHRPGSRYDLRIVSPYARVADRWTFEAIPGGTRVHFSTEGRARRALRPLERPIATVMERRRRAHHARLKRALEGRGAPPA